MRLEDFLKRFLVFKKRTVYFQIIYINSMTSHKIDTTTGTSTWQCSALQANSMELALQECVWTDF